MAQRPTSQLVNACDGEIGPVEFASRRASQRQPGAPQVPCRQPGTDERAPVPIQERASRHDERSELSVHGLVFRDCRFYALPGMGIVSQFTENLTFQHVQVVPRPGTLRTCPAWADCFHFSGCKGKVLIDSCTFSGTQDDPINVHGTYLRLVQTEDHNRVLVRFMHPQTYGFAAFQPGHSVEFVSSASLRAYAASKVVRVERRSDTDWVLTLNDNVPDFKQGDVLDNVTWYPDLDDPQLLGHYGLLPRIPDLNSWQGPRRRQHVREHGHERDLDRG